MSYRATHTYTNGTVTIIGDYWTREDAVTSCATDHALTWEMVRGSERFLDPSHAYDRGQFSQWGGLPRLYVSLPDGGTAHYDIAELSR